ncbi:RNA polymerase sigma-70 factor (ECF subfamily) [Natronocella acetinitrilica]|uniref:RNA polymerase sigma-70 factor (ECF subfamily) n=2 Tax=Natronocella acetinitrilica TaxID=414046 RepID=A0AAE3KDH5_9GAMM|nr:RNA polymerase sigma-70 factor (ECF subfamily) [Natronocella acetinitrilica]
MRPTSEKNCERMRRRERFERVVTELMDRLYGTALRLTRNADEAEEIVAESVSRAWSALDSLEDLDRLDAWLFRILNTTFISAWRRKQTRNRVETPIDVPEAGMDDGDEKDFSLFEKLHQPFLLWWGSAEDVALNDLLREDLQQAIDDLPDAFRIVIVLVEIQGYTYQEVAELLEIPLGTVRSRLSRARGMLQRTLWQLAQEAGLSVASPDGGSSPSGGRQ